MIKIEHQLKHEPFYIPTWHIEHLFLGTFNPSGGEKVNYYYGRAKNQTWPTLSAIFDSKLDPKSPNFFELLEIHKIGCIDLIDAVEVHEDDIDLIQGKGYSDNKIINANTNRIYNTNIINDVINKNPGINVYSTWGSGSNLKEWQTEISKINDVIPLVSPSLAARVPKGVKKLEYILSNWKQNIKS